MGGGAGSRAGPWGGRNHLTPHGPLRFYWSLAGIGEGEGGADPEPPLVQPEGVF